MRALIGVAAALALLAAPARAQDYPRRTIRILEPLAAGSAVDVVTRIVADKMGNILGRALYIDNQPGAAGLIGMRSGARATPDGYTILAVNDSVVTVLPNIRKDAGYDPRKDFVPIVQLVRIHWALVASPSLSATTLQGFIAAAKARPTGSACRRCPTSRRSRRLGCPGSSSWRGARCWLRPARRRLSSHG